MSSEELKPKRKTRTSSAVKNRYNKKAYKQFLARLKPELYNQVSSYCERENLSKPDFIKIAIDELDK